MLIHHNRMQNSRHMPSQSISTTNMLVNPLCTHMQCQQLHHNSQMLRNLKVIISDEIKPSTLRSNFWSSFECEGGGHVKHMHAVSLLIHPYFPSNLMVTCLVFEISLLIHFQTVRNLAFDQVRTNEGGSKARFRKLHDHVIE